MMSDFTPGKWTYYPPSELDVIQDYEDCRVYSVQEKARHYIGTMPKAHEIERLLYRIDGKEYGHE